MSWYYVSKGSPPTGPYDVSGLKGLWSHQVITRDTCLWAEGRPEWQKLSDIPELAEVCVEALACAETSVPAAEETPSQVQAADPELDAFRAEIEALEPIAEVEADDVDAPATPEELSFEDDDGTVYVWDRSVRKYVEQGGADAIAAVSAAYDPSLMTYEPEAELIPSLAAAREAEQAAQLAELLGEDSGKRGGKRKKHIPPEVEGGPVGDGAAPADTNTDEPKHRGKRIKSMPAPAPQQQEGWIELKHNTSVYVTGLPEDVTLEEVASVFTKCGILREGDDKRPRIKIYRDKDTGVVKGDGLVTFLKQPSVALATMLLDGTPLRPGLAPMTVTEAKFEKREHFSGQRPAHVVNKKDKKKLIEKQEKALAWVGTDDKLPPQKVTVILHHMFVPDELALEPSLVEELEEDVRRECSKFGPVDKVRTFKSNPAGVMTVRFKDDVAALKCVEVMEGRWFGGRKLHAHMWDGFTNYNIKVKESAEEQQARLDAFARELEARAAAEADLAATTDAQPAASADASISDT